MVPDYHQAFLSSVKNLEQRGRVVYELSRAYRGLGRTDQAEAALKEFINRCQSEEYPAGEARGCYWVAESLISTHAGCQPGNITANRVELLLWQAIELCVRHGLDDFIDRPRLDLAIHYWSSRQKLSEQERLLVEVRGSLNQLERYEAQGALTLLMGIYGAQGRWDEARSTFRRSLTYGGPHPLFLIWVLARWEEQLVGEGRGEWLVRLCGEWQAEAQAAGIARLPVQWFLEPARSAPNDGPLLLSFTDAADEEERMGKWEEATPGRSSSSAASVKKLTWVDPTRVGPPRFSRGRLVLSPPMGPDLWSASNLNAPRLMGEVEGDFIAETRVEIDSEHQVHTGLLLWSTELDFVRFERVHTSVFADGVMLEGCVHGEYRCLGRGRMTPSAVWLRLERTGATVRALCSVDREQWWSCGTAPFPVAGPVQVGIACVAKTPGATASFEQFIVRQAVDQASPHG